jgi:hypothetical protein
MGTINVFRPLSHTRTGLEGSHGHAISVEEAERVRSHKGGELVDADTLDEPAAPATPLVLSPLSISVPTTPQGREEEERDSVEVPPLMIR